MIRRALLLILAVLILNTVPTLAADKVSELKFKPNTYSAVWNGTVVRGDRDIIQFNAGAGQSMYIELSSTEHNACLEVFPLVSGENLGASVEETSKGFCYITKLPVNGAYRMIISPARGNLNYDIKVTIE